MLSPCPRTTLESFVLQAVARHATAPTMKSRRMRMAETLDRDRQSANNICCSSVPRRLDSATNGQVRSFPELEHDRADQQDEQSHSGAQRAMNDRRQRDGPARSDEYNRRDGMSRHADP